MHTEEGNLLRTILVTLGIVLLGVSLLIYIGYRTPLFAGTPLKYMINDGVNSVADGMETVAVAWKGLQLERARKRMEKRTIQQFDDSKAMAKHILEGYVQARMHLDDNKAASFFTNRGQALALRLDVQELTGPLLVAGTETAYGDKLLVTFCPEGGGRYWEALLEQEDGRWKIELLCPRTD